MSSNKHPKAYSLYFLACIMLIAGIGLTWYRHVAFDIPWLPEVKRQIWSVEAKIEFEASNEPIKLSMAIPDTQAGFDRVTEHTASPGYGLAFQETPQGRRAEWSIRTAEGSQILYYQVDMMVNEDTVNQTIGHPPNLDYVSYAGPEATALEQMLQRARERSADAYTLTRELIAEFNRESQLAQLLEKSQPRSKWLVDILHRADIPARIVHTLFLEDGRRRQPLVEYLQVFDGTEYALFDTATGSQGQARNQLLWEQNSTSLLDLTGGRNSTLSFSIIRQEVPATEMFKRRDNAESGLLDISIHSLPLEEQALFKGILLVPVGVLLVVIFRVLIGIRTSGTFMPVLIAIAFIQTSLLTGLIGFVLIVGTGLLIRAYLSRHNLLLVARISAVIICVIIIIALFALLAFWLGLSEGLKITFFPMIILSWTIERMSILWEEEGPHQVVKQGGGSLMVAIIAYLAMSNDIIRHLMFNFIGLQFVFMAVVLLLGNYTGYRLTELKRFQPLINRK